MSQSLWNRAGSFDIILMILYSLLTVSIPLEQGGVFRHSELHSLSDFLDVSIPLEQGGVFRHLLSRQIALFGACFNPFGAGRGLSTKVKK